MYEFGTGVQRSLTEAVKWYRLAVEQGYAEGQTNLGVMCKYRGDQSVKAALFNWQLAGVSCAKISGIMVWQGVQRSLTEVVKWYDWPLSKDMRRPSESGGCMKTVLGSIKVLGSRAVVSVGG